MIAIVDYGAGNLQSVQKALEYLGAESCVTADAADLRRADGVILPGVGAFADAMQALNQRGLVQPLRHAAQGETPFLGICLGMQLLFAASEESPGVPGLGVFAGEVLRLPANGVKVPHIGFNSLRITNPAGIFGATAQDTYVYFVHSYYVKAANTDDVSARADYGIAFDAAVCRGNTFAVQFHPEKSGDAGLAMLRQFAALCK